MINQGYLVGEAAAGGRPSALARRSKTEVCITIDTEFSIGGTFANPSRYRPISTEMVECRVGGREEGLGFLLRSFRDYGVQATFFVEVLQTIYYGKGPMGAVAERIAREGHDVQVHLHPGWLHFGNRLWRDSKAASDSCAARDEVGFAALLNYACDVFAQWGLPRPLALRAGGFQCDRNVYRTMQRCDWPLSSNVALGIYHQPDPSLRLASGRHLIEGVMEIPVLGYSTELPLMAPRVRNLAITATSWGEMEALLWAARENEISPVVILTHPFEFVKRDDYRYRVLRRNGVNQRRLEKLLDFIRHHSNSFTTATFAGNAKRWRADGAAASKLLHSPRRLSFARAAQNYVNDLL
jgi:hypothetical protein